MYGIPAGGGYKNIACNHICNVLPIQYYRLFDDISGGGVDLPQVDPEASGRLAAAKLRGARSTCFACKNIHLIKILARKLI